MTRDEAIQAFLADTHGDARMRAHQDAVRAANVAGERVSEHRVGDVWERYDGLMRAVTKAIPPDGEHFYEWRIALDGQGDDAPHEGWWYGQGWKRREDWNRQGPAPIPPAEPSERERAFVQAGARIATDGGVRELTEDAYAKAKADVDAAFHAGFQRGIAEVPTHPRPPVPVGLREWLRDFYNAPRFSTTLDLRIGTHAAWLDATLADIGPPPASPAVEDRAGKTQDEWLHNHALADARRERDDLAARLATVERERDEARAAYHACAEAAGVVYDDGSPYDLATVCAQIRMGCAKECPACVENAERADAATTALHAERGRMAALVEAARDFREYVCDYIPRNPYALDDALVDLSTAAAEHDERVRAEGRLQGWRDAVKVHQVRAMFRQGARVEVHDPQDGVIPNGEKVVSLAPWVPGTVEFVTGGPEVGGFIGHVSVYCDDGRGRRVVEPDAVRLLPSEPGESPDAIATAREEGRAEGAASARGAALEEVLRLGDEYRVQLVGDDEATVTVRVCVQVYQDRIRALIGSAAKIEPSDELLRKVATAVLRMAMYEHIDASWLPERLDAIIAAVRGAR